MMVHQLQRALAMAREVVVGSGASRAAVQSAIDAAAKGGLPVFIEPGNYKIDQTLELPPGLIMRSNLGVLLGTSAAPILKVSGGGIIDGLVFQAGAEGVTGITGGFVRTLVCNCSFWTSIAYCIDGSGLISRIEKCSFGLSGPISEQHQHIRIRGGGSNNMWFVRDCDLYHAVGEASVEFGDGYMVEIAGCNIERNLSRVAVKMAGMSSVHIHDNWFENNAGASQVELVHDKSDQIGNYVVNSHNNWWSLTGKGNKQAYLTYGACSLDFDHESGTSWNGKQVASEKAKVNEGPRNHLVGYSS
jgi:hypothetical protein